MLVCCVAKKTAPQLRKILPLVAQGYLFGPPRRPRDLGLWGGSALTRCKVDTPGFNVSCLNIEAFYTYLCVPEWMIAYQGLPSVSVAELGPMRHRVKHLSVNDNRHHLRHDGNGHELWD